ncbi:lysine-rich arabinogalactan protein 18-like [Phragmites australis]|uniref:lysine-rich arabinogalactan protein 18-like n=1 Tax=Phragmites australis TaxID=29695 RepID=UPI002D76EB9E|nr:lysine-rich arabinogalactan protein 18-like [Phragmites australis]
MWWRPSQASQASPLLGLPSLSGDPTSTASCPSDLVAVPPCPASPPVRHRSTASPLRHQPTAPLPRPPRLATASPPPLLGLPAQPPRLHVVALLARPRRHASMGHNLPVAPP